ncbi:MAG: DEAD/DEAH box helicase family protein [Deltaproteobacteria bacterium]
MVYLNAPVSEPTASTPDLTLGFDAGSLLLHGLARDASLASLAEGFTWDARVHRFRAPAYAYREIVTLLTRAARTGVITFRDDARGYSALPLEHRATREPFGYQREAIERWTAAGRKGVVVLPTGSGKSYVAEMAMLAVQRSTLVVAPTLDLMNQWHAGLGTAFGIEVGLLGGGVNDVRDVTVSTYDSAYIHMDRLGGRFGFLVFDECHHLPSPTYLHAAECAIAPYRLGLTATLERTDGREALLDARVGPVVYEKGIRELAGEYLADYDVQSVNVALEPDEAERYAAQREVYRAFVRDSGIQMGAPDGWSRFIMLSSRSPEGRRAFMAYRDQKQIAVAPRRKLEVLATLLREHAGDRVLIFTNDNETVYRIARGFLIPALTHQTPLKERAEILARFNSGAYPVVVTSRVLNEGVNIPEASVAVILSGTGSVREHVQRLGRILRRKEGKRAVLYEVITVDTVEQWVSERRREHDAYR